MYLPSNAPVATRGHPPAFFEALARPSTSSAYTPKSAGSALVIGKIVLTMLVAAAKINQSSIVTTKARSPVYTLIDSSKGFGWC